MVQAAAQALVGTAGGGALAGTVGSGGRPTPDARRQWRRGSRRRPTQKGGKNRCSSHPQGRATTTTVMPRREGRREPRDALPPVATTGSPARFSVAYPNDGRTVSVYSGCPAGCQTCTKRRIPAVVASALWAMQRKLMAMIVTSPAVGFWFPPHAACAKARKRFDKLRQTERIELGHPQRDAQGAFATIWIEDADGETRFRTKIRL